MTVRSSFSRREILRRLVILSGTGAAILALPACSNSDKRAVCADPKAMSAAEKGLREGQHYVEASPDPSRTCGGCAFFTAGNTSEACGQCQIFSGPANRHGHCDAWAAKG